MLEAAKHGFVSSVCLHLDDSLRDDCCFATQLAETAIPGDSSLKLEVLANASEPIPKLCLHLSAETGNVCSTQRSLCAATKRLCVQPVQNSV